MTDRTLVLVMVNGIGAHLTNVQKRAHLIDLKRDHLIDQVCVQEISAAGKISLWAFALTGTMASLPRGPIPPRRPHYSKRAPSPGRPAGSNGTHLLRLKLSIRLDGLSATTDAATSARDIARQARIEAKIGTP